MVAKMPQYHTSQVPITTIRQLLSYALGSPHLEKVERVLDQYSQSSAVLYVAIRADDEPLGIVGFREHSGLGEILHIAVEAPYRNQGIASEMLDRLIALHGLREIVAETDAEAIGFYRRYGFETSSLGEKYPGIERFHCHLRVSR